MHNKLKFNDKILLFPLWFISLIPLRVLFVFSWIIYFFLYKIIGYRRKVVYENLRRSFPEKNEKEIRKIASRFYLHLCDSIFEVIHMFQMSPKEISRRYKLINPEVSDNFAKQNKNVVVAASHYGNWEWASYADHLLDFKLIGVYKPLSNRMFNNLFVYLRGRLGGYPTPMKGTLRAMMDAQRNNENFMVYLVGDQRPEWGDLKHWTTFMNQETPVITGPEKLAKRFNLATVFMDTKQVKRGYYEITFHVISENSKETEDFEITNKYIQLVEEQIRNAPEFYLWSHKRWKYKKEEILGAKK